MSRARVIILALGLDLLFGEPNERWHPVVGMGRLVALLDRGAPAKGNVRQLGYGSIVEAICLAAVTVPALLVDRWLAPRGLLGLVVSACLLKPTLSVRALFQHVRPVETSLKSGDLPSARNAVGRIVSRDVEGLGESEVAAAAVESLAENASDSVVAPLLYYGLFGLPGAYLYRMANTLDAMLGYHGHYEYLGKAAARVDDLLNLIPARAAALSVTMGAAVTGGSPARAWGTAVRDSNRTESPNAGWPMGAVAGALNLRLEKVGHYVLRPEGRPPVAADVARARRLVGAALTISAFGALLISRRRPSSPGPFPHGGGRGEARDG